MDWIICQLQALWRNIHASLQLTLSNIIIRSDILPEQKQTFIQPVSHSFRTVTSEKAPILGKGDLCVRIGSQEAVHLMQIADIQD